VTPGGNDELAVVRYTDSMRTVLSLAAALALVANVSTAQSAKKTPPPKTLTLTGCVERDETTPDQYTITDRAEGTKYRVTGKDFREYIGRLVQLDGGIVVKGITIKGGLQPNPNIAAQAGAIDPSRAAVEAQTTPQATRPPGDIQEFRVKTIKPQGGSCK
jgi:hypothetical protein